jgi:MFS family permease
MLFMPDWWVIALAIFLGAVALEPVNPMMMSILQEQVPPGMRARIYSVASALYVVTLPIGIVAYGYLITWLGMDETLTIFVVLNLALPVIMFCVPDLRHIPKRPRSIEVETV